MLNIKEDIISKINSKTLLEHCFDNLELKSNWNRDCGKKISALGNKNMEGPSWLCIGINDSGDIGNNSESWVKDTEEIISQHINQFLDPCQACKTISCHELDNKYFIIIHFENPGAVVYWDKKAYKTSGTTILEMQPEEIMGLTIKLPGLTDYTSQEYTGRVQNDLIEKYALVISEKRRETSLASLNSLSPEKVLQRIGIKNKNVCKILFGNTPYRTVYYDKKQNPLINESHEGLYKILDDDFISHVQEWSKQKLNVQTNPYPYSALREALANAVAHAAYFEEHGDIILEIYPDKLTISNLCLSDSIYFANKWFSNAHKTINNTLMETLRLSGYVDELGRGKNRIFSESLKNGKKPPLVIIEEAGRLKRWRLFLYGGTEDRLQLTLLKQLREMYKDEHKALMANALVLWSGQPVKIIKRYIEGESQALFIEILKDLRSPIFYYRENEEIVLRRWFKVLLAEGKESKQLTAAEEKDAFEFARDIQTKYHNGFLTPKDLRDLLDLGDTQSSHVMSSKLLKNGKVRVR
jgi:predicted HTH transcriptional regulator